MRKTMKRLYVLFTYHLIPYTANRNNSLIQQSLRTIEGPEVILAVRVVGMHSDCFPQGMQQGHILPYVQVLYQNQLSLLEVATDVRPEMCGGNRCAPKGGGNRCAPRDRRWQQMCAHLLPEKEVATDVRPEMCAGGPLKFYTYRYAGLVNGITGRV